MTVLVTGAAGFIGFFLAEALSRDPACEVVCVDNFIRGVDDEHYKALASRANVTTLAMDLADFDQVRRLGAWNFDSVLHMAAFNGTQNFYERPFDVLVNGSAPTINLLKLFGEKGTRRFVYAGTSESYASTVTRFGWPVPTAEDVPLSIDDPLNTRWSYAGAKMFGEVAVASAATQYKLPFSIVRYHNVYGPRMGDKHVVPDFLDRGRRGVFELFGYEDTRSFLFIDDAVDATVRLMNSPGCAGQIVNIGSTGEITMLDLAHRMMKVCGWAGDIKLNGSPAGSVKRRVPDTQKLARLTGFAERWSLDDGLRATADFYVDGRLHIAAELEARRNRQ